MDYQIDREPVPPRDAATVIVVRQGARDPLEVFCVERNKQTRFMGGAIVFPGGKLDESDASDTWLPLTTTPRTPQTSVEPFAEGAAHLRALAIAAARETLEEAALLHVQGGVVTDADVIALRARLATDPTALTTFLSERALTLDLAALVPFARWITPTAESRRFDARFFVAIAPEGQLGAHDERETMASFWATPADVLRRFDAGEVTLWAPTHRTLSVLASCASPQEVLALAERSCLDPICPRLVPHTGAGATLALVLPGDPEHEVSEARVAGTSRYVLRANRWLPEDAPH